MDGTQHLSHAIVGIGAGILSAHLPALQQMATIKVVGGSDVSTALGAARAQELGCPFFTDHR